MTKIISAAVLIVAMVLGADGKYAQAVPQGKLNSSDGKPSGASTCLPDGLTLELVRSWKVVQAEPKGIMGTDGEVRGVLEILYEHEGVSRMVIWTVDLPVTAMVYDPNVEELKEPVLYNSQIMVEQANGKYHMRPASGACRWEKLKMGGQQA